MRVWHLVVVPMIYLLMMVRAAIAGRPVPRQRSLAAIATSARRLQPCPRTIVLVAALSSALMPSLLPKMHDRYFFVPDIITLTVGFLIPRLRVIVPLLQVGSLLSYLPYFGLSGRASVYAVLPVTFGVCILTLEYGRAKSEAMSACERFSSATAGG